MAVLFVTPAQLSAEQPVAEQPVAPVQAPPPLSAEALPPNDVQPVEPEARIETPSPEAPSVPAKPPVAHKPAARPPAAAARVARPAPPSEARPPEVATQPSPVVPAQQAAEGPISLEWQQSLAAWLARNKTYPDVARRRGSEGVVVLQFTADRTGNVFGIVRMSSSGDQVLDAAAEDMLRRATLPPFPASMPQDKVKVTVPIRYQLRN